MIHLKLKRIIDAISILALIIGMVLTPFSFVKAADHAESTSVATDAGADIADVFVFLNPNDNSKVVLALTFEGFIVPSELSNLGYFPPDILYRFEIENNGDAVADRFFDITFSPQTSRSTPQMATVTMTGRRGIRPAPFFAKFKGLTTVSNLNATAPPFVVTTDPISQISFFAGMTDDPFYFDIPAFNRFTSSVLAGNPNPTLLNRARDSFAGYNIHSIALEVPANLLRGSAGNMIGVNGVTLRQRNTVRQDNGDVIKSGDYVQVDRMATPAVNTVLIPYPRKNEFNAATPREDANLLFADSIIATLTALGTSQSNIVILANIAVFKGDYLRLDMGTPNMSQGFGERITSPNYTGFPNGRRLGDDTVDTLTYFVTNQAITMGENVNSNEVPLTNTFPFFGRPHQPLDSGTDPTQN
jgi:hypothetical protein